LLACTVTARAGGIGESGEASFPLNALWLVRLSNTSTPFLAYFPR
jgi:hypothetical protein